MPGVLMFDEFHVYVSSRSASSSSLVNPKPEAE
jgi:hypothetical protein